MPETPTRVPPNDLADRVELRFAPDAPAGDALPSLVRWLRAVRDRKLAHGEPADADDSK